MPFVLIKLLYRIKMVQLQPSIEHSHTFTLISILYSCFYFTVLQTLLEMFIIRVLNTPLQYHLFFKM